MHKEGESILQRRNSMSEGTGIENIIACWPFPTSLGVGVQKWFHIGPTDTGIFSSH